MKRTKLLILICSLLLGFTGTCAFAEYLPEPSPQAVSQMAWWSGLYPEYCLPDAMKLAGEENRGTEEGAEAGETGREEELPIRIRFKYLTFLND